MDPYVGEIRTFAFGQIPRGWAPCNGQLLAISTNAALFSILGTNYGGNGTTNFALPNLQGATMMHAGSPNTGVTAGVETVTLVPANLPQHNHLLQAVNVLGSQLLNNGDDYLAQPAIRAVATDPFYAANGYTTTIPQANAVQLIPNSIGNAGGGQPHENRMPFLTMSVCIALVGVYPSRN